MPTGERMSGILLSASLMSKRLLDHQQSVPGYFVESFTKPQLGEEICRMGFEIVD